MPDAGVPRSPAEVTGAWVHRCLGREQPASGAVEVERVGEGYGLASVLLRVRLGGAAEPASVVVKLWSTEQPSGDREASVLRAFGERLGPRVPACYHAEVDEQAARAALVLEDLKDVEQGDCLVQLSPEPAARLARELAALHATWWRSDELDTADWLARSPWLGLRGEWFEPRRARLLERFGDRLDGHSRQLLDRLEDAYAGAVAWLAATPTTLLHDDVHLDNVVFERATGEPVLLDWARAATGPAVLDLAELLVAIAAPAGTDLVLSSYLDALRGHGVPDADLATLERDVAAAVVVCFTRMTCGVARWEPASPREARMIDLSIDRARRGLAAWRHRAHEL